MVQQGEKKRLVLLGHSSGAGFLLNYSSYKKRIDPERYVFLAPEFGYKAETGKETDEPFAEAKIWVFIASSMTGGLLFSSYPAVTFNYPEEIRQQDPLLLGYLTRNMALTNTPGKPQKQFAGIAPRSHIFIGENDEVIDPRKLSAFVQKTPDSRPVVILPDINHLSVLTQWEVVKKVINGN